MRGFSDAPGAGPVLTACLAHDACRSARRRRALGNVTRKMVPPPVRGLHLDLAAVVGDDAVDDGQAEAGAFAERAAEWLEDGVDVFGRDADALVFDPQHRDAAARRGFVQRASAACRPRASRAGRWWPGSR